MTNEKLTEVFKEIQLKLDNGLSSAAENIINDTLRSYTLKLREKIRLYSQLAFVYETQGRYRKRSTRFSNLKTKRCSTLWRRNSEFP